MSKEEMMRNAGFRRIYNNENDEHDKCLCWQNDRQRSHHRQSSVLHLR